VQGRSESRWRVIAHRRGGREARLARGDIREHDAFLGHEMRGPAGTGRGGVSMAGGRKSQGARKANGVWGRRLTSPSCLFQICLRISAFCLDKEGCSRTSVLRTHIHEFLYMSYFFFIVLSNTYLIFGFTCLTLSLADTHGIAQYARTSIRRFFF